MKSLIPKTMTAVSTVALALAAGGCGGGGSSRTPAAPAPMSVDMTSVTADGTGYAAPEAGTLMIDAGMSRTSGSVTFACAAGGGGCAVLVAADGSVTSTGGTVTATHSDAYRTALDAEAEANRRNMKIVAATALDDSTSTLMTRAGGAGMEGSALHTAGKYSTMFSTLASDGNSRTASMNARKVLDARRMLMDARRDAGAKRAAAVEARTGLADDDPLAALLDGAITRADAQIGKAVSVLDGDDLKRHVEAVTGTGPGDMMTAADRGRRVARAVATALAPASADSGAGTRVRHGTGAPADTIPAANRYSMSDATGRTFAMIAGEGNLVDMRVHAGAVGGARTRAVKAASFAGMPLASITSGAPAAGDAIADGAEYATAHFRGIDGVVFCAGACAVEGETGSETLKGGWYFAPTRPTAYYVKAADDPATPEVDESRSYVEDTTYATWGHWLTVAGNGAATVHTFARSPTTSGAPDHPGSWAAADPASEDAGMRMSTATYSGRAAGRSVHRTLDPDGAVTDIQSGRFTADVLLTARFGGTPMLGGTVSNFMSEDNPGAVDSSWTVTLVETGAAGGTVTAGTSSRGDSATGGHATAPGANGTWSATSYGEAGMRPAGIYGGFNAHFTDGHVAGAWATRRR